MFFGKGGVWANVGVIPIIVTPANTPAPSTVNRLLVIVSSLFMVLTDELCNYEATGRLLLGRAVAHHLGSHHLDSIA